MSKVSLYNLFRPWQQGYYIAFNARTGALALMTEANYQTYLRLASSSTNGGDTSTLNAAETELQKQLEFGKFMLPDSENEVQWLKFLHQSTRYDRRTLGLVIAPTMACNMACPYCFEGNKKGKMSPEIVEGIIGFVDKQAKSLDKVDVDWYGGEPLLAMDIIEDLAESLIDLGREKQFAYTSSIVTNGYLMTKDVVDKLAELHVSICQVTLDGPERLHNQRRPLKNGKDSFQTILDNVKYASSKMMISVRVNVDKTVDLAAMSELLGQLKAAGLQQRIAVYFGQLEPSSMTCAAIADTCFDTVQFSEVEIGFYRQLLDEGFAVQKLPSPSAIYCMAQHINGFIVDPEGNICRCWNYVGDPERSMGNIRNYIDFQHPNFTRLFSFDPFEDERVQELRHLAALHGWLSGSARRPGIAGH